MYTLQTKVESEKLKWEKFFTTDTTSSINVAMTVEPVSYDENYTAEVQSAELKVWNEGTRLFCSVKATLEILDLEMTRNSAIVVVEESKIALPSLSKDITYRGKDDFVTIESIDARDNVAKNLVEGMIDCCLEIDVRIEGI